MSEVFNQNYQKILKKFPQEFGLNLLKTCIHFILLIYWSVIILAPVLAKNSDKKLENIIYPVKKPNK